MDEPLGIDYKTWAAVKSPADLSGMSLVVYQHWDTRRGARIGPTWSEFEFETLPPSIIPWCVVMDVNAEEPRLVYRFWGTGRVSIHGQEMTGKSVSDFKPSKISAAIFKECNTLIATKLPQLFRKQYLNAQGIEVTINTVRLPISEDGKNVTKIISYALGDELTLSTDTFFQ
jgi:hypothetical protein